MFTFSVLCWPPRSLGFEVTQEDLIGNLLEVLAIDTNAVFLGICLVGVEVRAKNETGT